MKNFISLLLIVIIVASLALAILHVTGVFKIEEYLIAKLKENPKLDIWFKTRDEVVALSTEIDNLNTVISNKDQDTQKTFLEIEKLKKEISKRDQTIEALKVQINEKQNQLEIADQHLLKIKEMSDIYSEMEPNKAAEILQGMDDELVVQIISAFKKDIAAEILSFFSPDRAALITKEYTDWKKN